MVTEAVELFEQPLVVTEYVTVYVPAVLALKLISPVFSFRLRPEIEVNLPPAAPVTSGDGLVPDLQNGEPL